MQHTAVSLDSGAPVTPPDSALTPGALTRTALRLVPVSLPLLFFGIAALVAGTYAWDPGIDLALLEAGAIVTCFAVLIRGLAALHRRRLAQFVKLIAGYTEHDAAPCFTTDDVGRIGYRNPAARARFGDGEGDGLAEGQTLVGALCDTFASPAAVLYRLQTRARQRGAAHEDIVLRRGHMRLSVHRLGAEARTEGYLWRLEDLVERAPARGAEGIGLPMLTATRSGAVLYMNDAMRRLAGGRETTLDRVFNDLPLRPGKVHEVAGLDGPARCRVAEFDGPTGRREIYLFPAEEADDASDWSLADDFPVPMLQLTAAGKVVIANRRARELLGPASPEGRMMSDLVEGLGRSITDWLGEAAAGQGQRQPEVVRARREDREMFLQVRLGRLGDGPSRDCGADLVAVLNDATELKTLEAQFVQSQKMQAIGQLAGGVAHDFNNLLTAISGHCDLLLLRHDQADDDYADLIQISQNANRAAALVSQLLAFSRKQNLQPQILDLREVLADHAHLLNRLVGEKVRLQLAHADGLPPIRADRRQFEQVMMNLVVNARDAMLGPGHGGTVRISTGLETLDQPLRRDRATVPAGDYVVIRVADEGSGIPPDRLSKIFEPFYTTKKAGEGTGLGLSTVYGIVKQTGGYVFVDSEPGAGSTFSLYFPAHQPMSGDVRTPATQARGVPAVEGGTVLLVEDEAPVRAFAGRALRLRGFTVIEADSAEEALKTLEDPALEIDVFVTDVVMPGLDGPTWVAEALTRRPDVHVVFISGYAEDSVAEHQARIPNAVFLPKPFSLKELTQTVEQELARRESA